VTDGFRANGGATVGRDGRSPLSIGDFTAEQLDEKILGMTVVTAESMSPFLTFRGAKTIDDFQGAGSRFPFWDCRRRRAGQPRRFGIRGWAQEDFRVG